MKRLLTVEIPEKRIFGLDLLRFIAIITVLISHSILLLPTNLKFLELFSTDGVLIFFVLSGFLIGRILIRDFNYGISLHKMLYFWKRRWFRTLPAYFFTICFIIILSLLLKVKLNRIEIIKSLFFVQNISFAPSSFFPESWSLAIEEWFYLLLPILLFVFYKIFRFSVKKNIIISALIVLIISLAIRIVIFNSTEIGSIVDWDNNFRKPIITRLDSILLGVIGAWFYIYKNDLLRAYKTHCFICGFIIFAANKLYLDYILEQFGFYYSVIYFTAMPFSILLMLPAAYYLKEAKGLFSDIISFVSLISYSLYLLNFTIIIILILNPLHLALIIKFLLFWILTPLLSVLMYKYIEQPFIQLRNKMVKVKES
ncbi:acyltransferase [uncultured Chryseobacterium sp.]|uniref:acyltransferase family protein n=1 Tax=uncultured Chryseobacterium sp. TaxID=259322 RepID=UPI0025FB3E29|nr:acyltransferase [uncultured Chryseobacterium sp.]